MSGAPLLDAVALVHDADPKVAALARAVVSLARSTASVRRIGIVELEQRLGVDRSTIFRMVKRGDLPAPSYCGTRRVWDLVVIEAWEAERAAVPHVPHARGIVAARRAKSMGKARS